MNLLREAELKEPVESVTDFRISSAFKSDRLLG
jgi:hypothetical protein